MYSGFLSMREGFITSKRGRLKLSKETFILSQVIKEEISETSTEADEIIDNYTVEKVAQNFHKNVLNENNYTFDRNSFWDILQKIKDKILTGREKRKEFRKVIKNGVLKADIEIELSSIQESLPNDVKNMIRPEKTKENKNSEWKEKVQEFVENVQSGGVAKGGVKGNN